MEKPNTAISEACRVLGGQAELARAVRVSPGAVNQWCKGGRPVPEDRAVVIERLTSFRVSADDLCPDTRWHRVPDPAWPNGKPLIDRTPAAPDEASQG